MDSPMICPRQENVTHFTISRGLLQPGYNVLLHEGQKTFYAEMDFKAFSGAIPFRKSFQKLTLRQCDGNLSDIAVSYIPWVSRGIKIGFEDSGIRKEAPREARIDFSDPETQQLYWEELKKQAFTWRDFGKEVYEWKTSTYSSGEKVAHLVWTNRFTWPMKNRKYILLDTKTQEVLASFDCDRSIYMGGMLTISKTHEPASGYFDSKILMAFLAIYEARRSKAHGTIYKASVGKGNRLNIFCYRTLEFLLRTKPPEPRSHLREEEIKSDL